MIVGQRYPQLFLKPHPILGEAIGATGQTPVALALCQIIAFDKAGVHRVADGGSRLVPSAVLTQRVALVAVRRISRAVSFSCMSIESVLDDN
jgi:hypothetical protein